MMLTWWYVYSIKIQRDRYNNYCHDFPDKLTKTEIFSLHVLFIYLILEMRVQFILLQLYLMVPSTSSQWICLFCFESYSWRGSGRRGCSFSRDVWPGAGVFQNDFASPVADRIAYWTSQRLPSATRDWSNAVLLLAHRLRYQTNILSMSRVVWEPSAATRRLQNVWTTPTGVVQTLCERRFPVWFSHLILSRISSIILTSIYTRTLKSNNRRRLIVGPKSSCIGSFSSFIIAGQDQRH